MKEADSGGVFNGRRVQQFPDGHFEVAIADYIKEKLTPLVIAKHRRGKPDEPVTEDERATFRAVLMKAMWVSRRSRPEILGSCSLLLARVATAQIKDLIELSRIVKHLIDTYGLAMTIHAIPLSVARVLVIADASPSGLNNREYCLV
eukprot:6090892-Amphidinium_carterae.2